MTLYTSEEVLSPDSEFWNNQQSPAISSMLDTLSWNGKKILYKLTYSLNEVNRNHLYLLKRNVVL